MDDRGQSESFRVITVHAYNLICTILVTFLFGNDIHKLSVSTNFLVRSTCSARPDMYIFSSLGPILILRFILDLRRASTSMDLSIDDIGTSGPSASLTGSLVFNRAVDEFCAPVASLSLPSPLGEDLYMQWDETEASSEEVESDGLSGVSLPE